MAPPTDEVVFKKPFLPDAIQSLFKQSTIRENPTTMEEAINNATSAIPALSDEDEEEEKETPNFDMTQ
jgi:hypothetical protein